MILRAVLHLEIGSGALVRRLRVFPVRTAAALHPVSCLIMTAGRPSASAVATHAVATRLDTDPGLFLTDKWFSAEEASAIRGHLRRLFGEMFLHQLRKANAGAAAEKLQGLLAAANKHCKPYKHVLLKAMRK